MWCDHHVKQGLYGSWVIEEGQPNTNARVFTLVVTLGGHRSGAGMTPTCCELKNEKSPLWLGWFTVASETAEGDT